MPLNPDSRQTSVRPSPGWSTPESPSVGSASNARLWVAFFLTTLITPILSLGWGGFYSKPFSLTANAMAWALWILLFSFPCFVIVGFPAFVILQRNAFHSFAAYAIAGGAVGLLNGVIWVVIFSVKWTDFVRWIYLAKWSGFITFLSVAGAASGLFFRAIAFPSGRAADRLG